MPKFQLKKSILAELPLLIGLAIGAAWLLGNYLGIIRFTTCPMKNITGLPCPSCGVTRASMKILHGDIWQGICLNPNCLLLFTFIIAFPVIFYLRHSSRPDIYGKINKKMSTLWFVIPFACVEIAIWIHNIHLGL